MQQLPVDGDMSADIIRQGKREIRLQGDIHLLKAKLQKGKKELNAAKVVLVSCVFYFSYN